jgi:hypothetical protein
MKKLVQSLRNDQKLIDVIEYVRQLDVLWVIRTHLEVRILRKAPRLRKTVLKFGPFRHFLDRFETANALRADDFADLVFHAGRAGPAGMVIQNRL